tara:strand:+ start:27587 stop:29701 length:2115 start_codon:yes stop_codon:yes gene_type:complete
MENFRSVVEKYNVQIPIIQRDYAQGRNNRKATDIRNDFLNSVNDALNEKKELHLDFVYGSIKDDKFIPLDGQQRLTTLFILYWYFGKKEGKQISFLKNFTYKTRASSREFCSKLVDSKIDFHYENVSDIIKNSNWFLAYWDNDPTIKAMLSMIDAVHLQFKDKSFFEELENITFNFFELEKFGLDDDLYIKMNARGKALTDFESFKAKFEKFLSEVDEDIRFEFTTKIDNQWTDFFWKYGVDNESFLIDTFFMNYFKFITQMIHYDNSSENFDTELSFKSISKIYEVQENIDLLFKSLDRLQIIYNSVSQIFTKWDYKKGKIALFNDETNILEKLVLGENINIQERILLYIAIKFISYNDANDDLLDLLRVSRNLTSRVRHRKNGYISYTNDLVFDQVNPLLNQLGQFINVPIYDNISIESFHRSGTGIRKESLKNEIDKAFIIKYNDELKEEIFKLEDFRFLRGAVHNFLSNDIDIVKLYNRAIRGLFKNDDSKIVRAILTQGDYSINVGWTILGHKYLFGKKNSWELILTISDKPDIFTRTLKRFTEFNGQIDNMINDYLLSEPELDWRYYFIKYSEMTSFIQDLSNDNNLYAWKDEFEPEKMGGSNLNAYHLNPYVRTATSLLSIKSCVVQFDHLSYFEYENLIISSTNKGWRIENLKIDLINKTSPAFRLKEKEGYYILKDSNNRDRIENIVEFINALKN